MIMPTVSQLIKTEQEIFEELAKLCVSPGYIHALASICFQDNIVGYAGEISGKDLLEMYSWDRLIRTEVMTILGLTIKSPIDYSLPEPTVVQEYIEETYRLLNALHEAMSSPFLVGLTPEKLKDPTFNPFGNGSALREPIFYSGEPAYCFQFRDLAVPKYTADDEWLKIHKGFSVKAARDVIQAFAQVQNTNLTATLDRLRQEHP